MIKHPRILLLLATAAAGALVVLLDGDAETVGSILLLAGLPGLFVFVVLYAVRSPWRSNLGGRVIMQLAATELLVLTLAAGQAIWGTEWPARDWIRLFIYFAMFVAFWRLAVTVVKVQGLPPIAPARPPEDRRGVQKEDPDLEAPEETEESKDARNAPPGAYGGDQRS